MNNFGMHKVKQVVVLFTLILAIVLPLFLDNIGSTRSDLTLPTESALHEKNEFETPLMLLTYIRPTSLSSNGLKNGFRYQYEIYKSSVIFTWNMSLDSTRCYAYSSQNPQHFFRQHGGVDYNLIPLNLFETTEFPIFVSLTFYGSDFTCSDSLVINL